MAVRCASPAPRPGAVQAVPPAAGETIPELVKGPMTTQHLMRWSAAIENWHRIHYDLPFATGHDGLPDLLVNGSWKQHVLAQLLTDWAGPVGWVADLEFSYRSADLCGDTVTAFGAVVDVTQADGFALAACTIGIRNQRGEVSTTGTATVALPLDGVGVPRPFGIHRPLPTVAPETREPTVHVGPETLASVGVPGATVRAPEPVDAGSVRRLAQAIMDDDPIHHDERAARAAGHPGVVAPPLFPLHVHRRAAGTPDPLRAAIEHPDDDGAGDVITKHGLPPLHVDLPRLLNGGNAVRIADLARIGDRITATSTVSGVEEKSGRSGPLVVVTLDTDYHAENRAALLLRARQTYIYR